MLTREKGLERPLAKVSCVAGPLPKLVSVRVAWLFLPTVAWLKLSDDLSNDKEAAPMPLAETVTLPILVIAVPLKYVPPKD